MAFSIKNVQYAPFRFKKLTSHRVDITLTEGKNRELRILFGLLNNQVIDLLRIRIGKYKLSEIKSGEYSSFKLSKST